MEELKEISVDPEVPSRVVKVGKILGTKRKEELVEILRNNLDVFAWSHEDMVGINPNVMMHTLNLDRNMPAKVQKRRLLGKERLEALEE